MSRASGFWDKFGIAGERKQELFNKYKNIMDTNNLCSDAVNQLTKMLLNKEISELEAVALGFKIGQTFEALERME